MKLEHESPAKLKESILKVLAQHLDLSVYTPFFFGSRVTGEARERSDIDLGISGPTPIPAVVWSDLVEAIEEIPILYTIDVVDFSRVSSDFKQVALRAIEPLLDSPL